MAGGLSEEDESILSKALAVVEFLLELLVGAVMTVVDLITRRSKSVKGQVVVVTGAAQGIGAEMSKLFASKGAKVALLDVNRAKNQEMAAEINAMGGEAYAFTCDVRNPEDMQAVAEKVGAHQDLGKADIVVCNAGILHSPKSLVNLAVSEIRKTIEINVLGVFWTIRAFLPLMIERNTGHIVAVSSVGGHFGESYASAYSASKFAVRGLMESVYNELLDSGKTGVKTTTIFPFFTKTPLIQQLQAYSRFIDYLEPTETAEAVVSAVLREKREAYIPWHMQIACNFLKGTSSFRAQDAFRKLLAIKYK